MGVSKARDIARVHRLPMVGVHHMEAHALVARWLSNRFCGYITVNKVLAMLDEHAYPFSEYVYYQKLQLWNARGVDNLTVDREYYFDQLLINLPLILMVQIDGKGSGVPFCGASSFRYARWCLHVIIWTCKELKPQVLITVGFFTGAGFIMGKVVDWANWDIK